MSFFVLKMVDCTPSLLVGPFSLIARAQIVCAEIARECGIDEACIRQNIFCDGDEHGMFLSDEREADSVWVVSSIEPARNGLV